MDDRDGSFDRFLKRLGIMVLIGVACFWAGRLTGRPEIVRVVDKVYAPPVDLRIFCQTLYPQKECPRQ